MKRIVKNSLFTTILMVWGMNEDAETEKEQMSELKRFYVEKFEGNVLREFYPEGALKSEVEVKEGKRHGRYREYYEDGTLKLRGKYANNKPKGTWKYYTEDGKFERKEKFQITSTKVDLKIMLKK